MQGARQFLSVLCLMVMSPSLQARTAVQAAGENVALGAVQIGMDGTWKLFYFHQGKNQISGPDELRTQGLAPIEADPSIHFALRREKGLL
jgi:hypothetical protein